MSDRRSFDIFDYYNVQKILVKREISTTYLANAKEQTESQTVIKVFDRARLPTPQDNETSRAYVKTLLSLQHRSIVPLFDIVFMKTYLYSIRAYLAHDSLDQRLQALPSKRFTWEEALDIILPIGRALSYAHNEAITHGNIKPENVLFNQHDEAMLADFSLAPVIHLSNFASSSDLHTAHYMAPEQFMGRMNHLSDQYALACLAYTLIAGHPPFEAQNITSLWNQHANENPVPLSTLFPQLPGSLAHAIMKALAKKPDQRYHDMSAFLLALESGTDALSARIEFSQNSLYNPYRVDIKTPLLPEPIAQKNTSMQIDATALPPAVPPPAFLSKERSIAASDPPHLDPYNETMTMFSAGELASAGVSADRQIHPLANSIAPLGDMHLPSTPKTGKYLDTDTSLFVHSSQKRTNQLLFWAAFLLLLTLFASSCVALVFNQPVSKYIALHARSNPVKNHTTPPNVQITSTPHALQTPQSSKKANTPTSSPFSAVTPTSSAVPSPQPQPSSASLPPAQATSPSSIPENPWRGSGGYGSGPYRPPFFFPRFRR